MRILAIVSNDNTYQPYIYELLVKELKDEFIGIVIVPFTTKQMPKIKMIIFLYNLYGLFGFLKKFIQVIKCKTMGWFEKYFTFNKCYSLKKIAKINNVPLYHTDNINSIQFIKVIKELHPDLIISSQGHFIDKQLRKIPKYGIINKHAGLLPKYRGIYPVFWAMINGDRAIGVTIHFMNEQIDGGDIILQKKIPIENDDTFESLYKKVVYQTPKLFLKAVDLIKIGDKNYLSNISEKSNYYTYPSKSDIKHFKKLGYYII